MTLYSCSRGGMGKELSRRVWMGKVVREVLVCWCGPPQGLATMACRPCHSGRWGRRWWKPLDPKPAPGR